LNINDWSGFFSYKPTKVLKYLLDSPCRVTCLYTGNQFGKNETAMYDYILRILGQHPNKRKNIVPSDAVRSLRFASHTLPGEKNEVEIKNTQYPVLKRRLPSSFIVKDITARKPVVTIKPLNGGNIQIEYVSFAQDVQAMAGIQRKSCWIDEECSRDFFEEQVMRMIAADGDIIFTFTPVPGSIGWEFDELYERARVIYRTDAVRDRIKLRTGEDLPEVENRESDDDICVIMAATDDNPMYEVLAKKRTEETGVPITAKEYIDEIFSIYDDEDVIDARRYGLFRQLSGKIHKSFSTNVHKISKEQYFRNGVPYEWKHFRGIDYHRANPWACVWMSISPQDEAFIWKDWAPTPTKMRVPEICSGIAEMSGDYRFLLDLIDPLAQEKKESNRSTVEDMNDYFRELRKNKVGTGAYWQSWDTHGMRGREEFTKRLINSIEVKKPFNNLVPKWGVKQYIPTVWITDDCRNVIEAMKNWRLEEWANREMLARNDAKEKEQARWSHFPITIECLFKRPEISNARWGGETSSPLRPKLYATGRR
jgi:hypothetical protein